MRLVLFLLWIFPVLGDPFSYRIDLSTHHLSLLENLRITATLTYPEGYEPDIDAMRRHLLNLADFIVVKEKIFPPTQKGNTLEQRVEWELAPEVPGKQIIASFSIPFKSKDHPTVELITDLYSVEVTMPPNINLSYEGALAPLMIYPPMPTLKHSPTIDLKKEQKKLEAKEIPIYWIILIVILISLLYFKPKFSNKILPVDPKREALISLESLRRRRLDYVSLTDVVRRYIEKKYHIKATTSTTEEFLKEMSEKPIMEKDSVNLLKVFLEEADRVKFAHKIPSENEILHALNSAKVFIEGS